jgi:DNA uptake protein ComE-like DNA-binding protein
MTTTPSSLAGRLAPALIALSLLAAAPLSPAAQPAATGGTPKAPPKAAAPQKLVDINSASKKELKTLPGIGDAEADRIVAARPFLTKADLVSAKAIPAGTYLSIRRQIIAKPPAKTPAKVPGKA